MENLHKVFMKMLKEMRERISVPHLGKDEVIANADDIKEE